jgi:hypothetical protein
MKIDENSFQNTNIQKMKIIFIKRGGAKVG